MSKKLYFPLFNTELTEEEKSQNNQQIERLATNLETLHNEWNAIVQQIIEKENISGLFGAMILPNLKSKISLTQFPSHHLITQASQVDKINLLVLLLYLLHDDDDREVKDFAHYLSIQITQQIETLSEFEIIHICKVMTIKEKSINPAITSFLLEQTNKLKHISTEIAHYLIRIYAEFIQIEKPSNDIEKVIEQIESMLFNKMEYAFFAKLTDWDSPKIDPFIPYVNELLQNISLVENGIWHKILRLAKSATASKPSAKFLKEMKSCINELGEDKFKQMLFQWFEFIRKTKEISYHNGYYNATLFAIHGLNRVIIKGLVWACSQFDDKETAKQVTDLALHSYSKIAGVGARYQTLGNACVYTLYRMNGLNGVAYLSRLRVQTKSSQAQKLITKYLDELATERGINRDDMEDMAVDNFGLQQGSREYAFNDYTAKLTITGVGKSDLQWFKPDGSPQKTVPAFVKEEFAEQLKEIKATQRNLNTMLTAQRDRLDRLLRSERRVSIAHAQQYYWQHGFMSWLTLPLIWQFYQDDNDTVGVSALCLNNVWVNELGEPIDISGCLKVNLFHPALATQQSVVNWRNLLIQNEMVQPVKQAFREIYLLTDAEIKTRTYSNRFAAHILKQHQYMTLARGRGWSGSLCGAYDDGCDDANVSLDLPEYDLTAHFWTTAIEENYVDSGIWQYISTDQVRFMRNNQVVDLIEIPPRIFSEVLRDVDLFVGVASVGNDPTWADNGGLPNHRNYWQSYSFGDLSEVAKTRKSILEMLLPRLKIAKVSHIDGNFLVVQGKLRTYKIHIGSTNILMLPNDQYLCIVPDRSQKDVTGKLFIPFEGDNGLSVVLSKAMLLMDDDKITDSTITSQIMRK